MAAYLVPVIVWVPALHVDPSRYELSVLMADLAARLFNCHWFSSCWCIGRTLGVVVFKVWDTAPWGAGLMIRGAAVLL